jgi:hypothetical protein
MPLAAGGEGVAGICSALLFALAPVVGISPEVLCALRGANGAIRAIAAAERRRQFMGPLQTNGFAALDLMLYHHNRDVIL